MSDKPADTPAKAPRTDTSLLNATDSPVVYDLLGHSLGARERITVQLADMDEVTRRAVKSNLLTDESKGGPQPVDLA